MQALSKSLMVDGCGDIRALIGKGLQAMSAGWHEVTHARRELYRKFISHDIGTFLYSNPPTHNQMFGGESIEAQIKKACEAAKDSKQFTFRPAKKPTSFYKNNLGFRKQAGTSYNNSKPSYRGRRGRGRFQNSRGKFEQSPSPVVAAKADK